MQKWPQDALPALLQHIEY